MQHPSPPAPDRLPRVRGDRPPVQPAHRHADESPPRTRGSTCDRWRIGNGHGVSPAYAGIDLPALWAAIPDFRLPRVRGDRPESKSRSPIRQPSPPRTRGSTGCLRSVARRSCVSPAYAGIDPCRPIPRRWGYGLPRVRGDRPGTGFPASSSTSSPPRTRGSTQGTTGAFASSTVSPAYAGIDPMQGGVAQFNAGLPRVRGDRPMWQTSAHS